MPPPAFFDLIIHHKGKVGRIHNVDPEMYSYFDMLADVNESVMSAYPPGLGLAFSVFCELAGSGYRVDLDSDKAILDLFSMDGIPSTLNLYVEVETPNSSQVVDPNQLEVNGDQDDVGDGNEGDDHVYDFSDEDNDWIGDMEGELELDDGGSLIAENITVPGDPLDPPPLKRLPGRPRKVRRRAADEPAAGTSESKRSQTVKCTWCKEFGHNKRTCQRGPVRGRGGSRGRGNTHNNGRVGASGNEIGGTVTAASTTSTGRGRGIYRGRGGGATRGRGRTRGGGTRGSGSTRGKSTARRGSSIGRGPNATSTNQGNQVGTSQTQPSQCVTQSQPSDWSLF